MIKQCKNLLIIGLYFYAGVILSINVSFAQQNPFITSMYLADPSAHVWNDGQLYVYPSHDIDPPQGCNLMDKYHVFSTNDMIHWTDHGEILNASQVPWGRKDGGFMWAPDCAYKDGVYYFYFPHPSDSSWNTSWKIGIATSTSPDSGFTCQGYIPGLESLIDPQVFQDADSQFYFYYGGGGICKGGKLKDNMMEIDGTMQDMVGLVDFHEGTWVFKKDSLYYLTYADNHSDATGDNRMCYATSTNPLGPWTSKGVYLDPTDSYTTQGSVVEYKGQWYQFYHNSSISHNDWLRSLCVDKLYFNSDGTIQKVIQTPVNDPYASLLENYNGSFESGLNFWRFFELPNSIGSTATIDSSNVADGSKAVKLTFVPPDNTLTDRGFDNLGTKVGVVPGREYSASVQAMTPTPGALKLNITFGFLDSLGNVLTETTKDSLLTNKYSTFSINLFSPDSAATCWVAFRLKGMKGENVAGTLFLDDAKILNSQTPYIQQSIPGIIQAEDFDYGGEGIAYHNNTPNDGQKAARPGEGVGTEPTGDVGGGYDVGWTTAGEWLEYTLDSVKDGLYNVLVRAAAPSTGASVTIKQIKGTSQGDTVTIGIFPIKATGDWQVYASNTVIGGNPVNITSGNKINIIRLEFNTGGLNVNWIGFEDATTSVINQNGLPTKFNLSQNYPNPFNPSTTISYSIPKASHIKLEIFNTLGQKVTTLVDEFKSAGNYKTEWKASTFASGIYYYRMQAGEFKETKKLILLK